MDIPYEKILADPQGREEECKIPSLGEPGLAEEEGDGNPGQEDDRDEEYEYRYEEEEDEQPCDDP